MCGWVVETETVIRHLNSYKGLALRNNNKD